MGLREKKEHETSPLEKTVEGILVLSRWLLTPIFMGLILILLAMIYKFYYSVYNIFINITVSDKKQVMLTVLELIDFALIASLVVMVAISGYENFVSSAEDEKPRKGKPSIFSELDPGKIKIKLAMSIIAISSIKLLQMYMEYQIGSVSTGIEWYVIMHLTFLVSGLGVTVIEKLSHKKKPEKDKSGY
ncbi:MAG TPA: hypothetical protein DIS76_06615 [Rhodospirillaceae bacterium]|nr:hypothetical protein [Rhodospirillaceae bacterium]